MLNKIFNENCLTAMRRIPDASIDLILCDLPYGTTRNTWDSIIPLDALWVEYRRIIKPRGAIVLFAQCPFDKILGASNLPWLKYEWIWVKEKGTDILNSHHRPMKNHENILVFSPASAAHSAKDSGMKYFPQYRTGKAYVASNCHARGKNYDYAHQRSVTVVNDGSHYMPLTVLHFKNDLGRKRIHPTQKPVDLLRYLIRTYTESGDVVLDNCMGSGSTIVAAIQEHRQYIGIELDKEIFDAASQRIEAELQQPTFCFDES